MHIVVNSPGGKEVDFEIETMDYAEYMCKDSIDIALNETVHVELTEDYETVYAFRFVPEKSGFYCAESDNGIHVNVFDADKERVAANKSNGYSYYLKKDCEYYFGLTCYESGNFYIAEYDGSSHSVELKENEPIDDKLYSCPAKKASILSNFIRPPLATNTASRRKKRAIIVLLFVILTRMTIR